MNLLQTWTIIGVPLLVASCCLFVGRDKTRARLGYLGLGVLLVVLVLVPQGAGQGRAISAGIVGAVAFTFVATGRGTHSDDDFIEHHEDRRRFTTTAGSATGDG